MVGRCQSDILIVISLCRKRKPEEEDAKEDVKKECVEKSEEAAASGGSGENTESKTDTMETETA